MTPLAALVRDPEVRVRLEVVRALRALRDLSARPRARHVAERRRPRGARGGHRHAWSRSTPSATAPGPVGRFLEIFSDEYDRSSVAPVHGRRSLRRSRRSARRCATRTRTSASRRRSPSASSTAASSCPHLVTALQDPDAGVRGAAATAIGKVGTAADGKHLIPLLADESAEVRNRVLQALGVLQGQGGGAVAARRCTRRTGGRSWGSACWPRSSRIADPAQADLFREVVQDPDPERKRLAIEGLGRISDPSRLAAFKKDYQREKQRRAAARLQLRADAARRPRVRRQPRPQPSVAHARHAQPELPPGDGVRGAPGPLSRTSNDPEAEVRGRARRHPGARRRRRRGARA